MVRNTTPFEMHPHTKGIHTSNNIGDMHWKEAGRTDSVILFDLILYVPSTIFQLCRDGSYWVEPVLS